MPCWMLRVVQHFSNQCSFPLHTVPKKLSSPLLLTPYPEKGCSPTVLTTCTLKFFSSPPFPQPCAHPLLDSSLLFHSTNQLYHIQYPTHTPPYIRLSKMTNQNIFTLKMANAMSAETSNNSQHLTQLTLESWSSAEWYIGVPLWLMIITYTYLSIHTNMVISE
jgi:hypothetical protein